MTVISTVADPETLSLTVVAEFEASPERVWGVWENPRRLERWWGPPSYPATFTRHDFSVGGESRYYMTGPVSYTHLDVYKRQVQRCATQSATGRGA